MRQAEMELRKGQNMIEHQAEIYSRPARTWFQTGKEKAQAEGTCPLWIFSPSVLTHWIATSKEQYEAGFKASGLTKEKVHASGDKVLVNIYPECHETELMAAAKAR